MAKKRSIIQVLGPVDSLESYVKADWWREIFNANYLRTDGDVVGDQKITRREVETFMRLLRIEPEESLLDLCCGQGRHALEFARKGVNQVYGLDRSHYLINKARSQNKKEGLSVTFKEGDARKLPFKTDFFDYVLLLGNSFGYFESQNDDLKVLEEVLRALKPQATLLIDVTDGDYMRQSFQPRSWEWIDKDYFVCRERSLSKDGERLISREVITHAKKGVIADQFYAERLYSLESLKKILQQKGFARISFHQEFSPQSLRNQDLGMMAKRIIVTAQADKEWTKRINIKRRRKNVAVLMGDPQLNDIIKPNNKFDEDDHYTISELKKALQELKDYRCTFYDNHSALVQTLLNSRQQIDFVFNLCDEGYNNEATKELHVPALLEILGIPYTGGTPQCLAFCYDKSLVRGIAKELDLPVPEAYIIKAEDTTFFEFPLQFPVIVKPNLGDSSFGITKESVCYDINQLENVIVRLREKLCFDINLLVEEYLTGKDLSVGIIGNFPEAYTVLPIIEEDYSDLPEELPRICGYEAKWDPTSPYWKALRSIPAELPEETVRFLVASCLKLFGRLSCRDYARFDWRLDRNGTPRLLEANPNPGWCWDGHLAKMAKLQGLSYTEMLEMILKSAETRIYNSSLENNK